MSHDDVQGEFHRNAKVGLRWNDDLASLGAKCGQMLRVQLGISSSGALCFTFSPHFHIGESRATHRCLIHWAGPGSVFSAGFLGPFFLAEREMTKDWRAGGQIGFAAERHAIQHLCSRFPCCVLLVSSWNNTYKISSAIQHLWYGEQD